VSQIQMSDAFKEASSDNILLVVLTNENSLTSADEEVYRTLVGKLRGQTDDVAALQDFITTPPLREILVSKDNKAWLLPVNIVGELATPKAIASTKRAIRTVQDTVAGTSLQAYTTGPAGTFNDLNDIGERDRGVIGACGWECGQIPSGAMGGCRRCRTARLRRLRGLATERDDESGQDK
jgi:RND superfamily putative drug exporter